MPAINFKKQFAPAVESGEKRQTIRARRQDGRDPVAGQTLYLYTGIRTKGCRKLGEVTCKETQQITIEENGAILRQTAEAFECKWPATGPTCRDLMVPYADIAQIEFNDFYGTWKWQKLGAACTQQEIDLSDLQMHGALDDCKATQRLYQKLKADFQEYWGNI